MLVHAISWHRLSLPHSLNALGSSRMLKTTSGTEPSPPPHTRDAAPVKSKVAPQFTASQGVDYHSTAHTVYLSHHREGHRRHMGHRTIVDTLYVVITAQVPLHIFTLHCCRSWFLCYKSNGLKSHSKQCEYSLKIIPATRSSVH